MSFIPSLFSEDPFLIFPGNLIGWLGLVVFFAVVVILVRRWRQQKRSLRDNQWIILAALSILVPACSLFLGMRLPNWGALPLPGVTLEPSEQPLMFFAALPWVLAAGMFGALPGAILGGISGLLIGIWGTHTLFTSLEFALLGAFIAGAAYQRYRTPFFKALRHPLFTSFLLSLFYPMLFLISALLLSRGTLASRLDYAWTHMRAAAVAIAGQLLIAGIIAEVFRNLYPSLWSRRTPLKPSPAESKMGARLLYYVVVLATVLITVLIVGDWLIAGKAARQMLKDRMASAAMTAAEGVPFFLDTGQSLIMDLANNPDWNFSSASQLEQILVKSLRNVPFFYFLYVVDDSGSPIAGFPVNRFSTLQLSRQEQEGVDLAKNGVMIQVYTVPPEEGGITAQVSFMAAIQDENGVVNGVLVGRTDLASNPFTQPLLTGLDSVEDIGGEGYLLDENGQVLYHPNPNSVMEPYTGQIGENPNFYDTTAPNGTRQFVYYQPAVGRPWAVALVVPAQHIQQTTLNIATPLLGIIAVLTLFAAGGLYLGLNKVTGSLQSLAKGAERIAQGDLEHELMVEGVDEIGQLGQTFEQMRISLSGRIFELNRLLLVSQGVASSLEMEKAVQPILESALATGACSARIVLAAGVIPDSVMDEDQPTHFGFGSTTDLYSYLDEQILNLTQRRKHLVLTNPLRTPLLSFETGFPKPEALMAVALRHENKYYGNLWVAYDEPHTFTEEEVRFLSTLASQAALAAANARLFLSAEIERRRLAAILDSTPDPVLVTDQKGNVLLTNPAAWQALGLVTSTGTGKPIAEIIDQPNLRKILESSTSEIESVEVNLPDGRVYLATASPILADEGKRLGRVCLLRNITQFKELDLLKSEFVATVSHDLRS
ncbi:MAG: HAMP domain-containing protein, partial [Anaerolineales bacterium]